MRQLQLQQRHEKAFSRKGRDSVERVLNAARDLLVQEGYAGLSMRKIAARCDMTVGNLSYYYVSKTDLMSDLIDAITQGYVGWWDDVMANESLTPEEQFATILHFIMDDLATPETTGFFTELWALANHEEFARVAMDNVYQHEYEMLVQMIGRLNPLILQEDRVILAVYMQASMEGHTIFVGHQKKWAKYIKQTANMIVKSYLHMVQTITHEEIHQLRPSAG